MATNRKKRRRRVQPRFYVIISIFILLVLTLIALIIWGLIVPAIKEKQRQKDFEIAVAQQQTQFEDEVNKNPEGYIDVVQPTISYDDFKEGATIPPVPTPIPTPTPTPRPTPYMVAESNPELYGFVPHLQVGASFENGASVGGEEVALHGEGAGGHHFGKR